MTHNCTHRLDSVGSSQVEKRINQQYLNRRFFATFRALMLPEFFLQVFLLPTRSELSVSLKLVAWLFKLITKITLCNQYAQQRKLTKSPFDPLQFPVLKYLLAFRKHQDPNSGSTKTCIIICLVTFSLHILLG